MQQDANALRAARVAAGWSQPRLIAAMRATAPSVRPPMSLPGDETLKTNIKRWENGRVLPGLDYRRLFRTVYGMTDHQLGFPTLDGGDHEQLTLTPSALSGDALAYYGVLLNEHIRADNLSGPRFVLDIVRLQVSALSSAARQARGPGRLPVLAMACRYHEFYGWVLQDSGRCGDATVSTDRARDFAAELGDAR